MKTMELVKHPKLQVPPYFWTHELTHQYGGNGLYFLEDLGRSESGHQWARVTNRELSEVRTVRLDLLEKWTVTEKDYETKQPFVRDFPIRPGLVHDLKQLREDLASGRKVIVNDFYIQAAPKL